MSKSEKSTRELNLEPRLGDSLRERSINLLGCSCESSINDNDISEMRTSITRCKNNQDNENSKNNMRRCVTDSDTKNHKKLQTNDNNHRQLRILTIRIGATPIRMSAIASKSIKNGLNYFTVFVILVVVFHNYYWYCY